MSDNAQLPPIFPMFNPPFRSAEFSRFTKYLPFMARPTEQELKWGTLKVLRARSRYVARNFAHAGGVIRFIARRVAGAGLVLQSRLRNQADGRFLRVENRQIDALIEQWAKTGMTPSGRKWNRFWTLAAILFLTDGEVFLRAIENPERKGITLEYQFLRGDQLAENDSDIYQCVLPGNKVTLGIEHDPLGRVAAYHFYKNGGTSYWTQSTYEIERVPADQIIAWQNFEVADSPRGIPILTPVVLRCADFDEIICATMTQAWMQAATAAYVETEFPAEMRESYAAGIRGGRVGTVSGDNQEEGLFVPTDRGQADLPMGTMQFMLPGEKVTLAEPKTPGTTFDPFTQMILRAIAAGIGISYEALAAHWSPVSYSGGTIIQQQDDMFLSEFNEQMDEELIVPIHDDLVDHIFDLNQLMKEPKSIDRHEFVAQHPRTEPVDKLKHAVANAQLLATRQDSLKGICARAGKDVYDVLDEIAEETAYAKEIGVSLFIAPVTKSANAGNAQRQVASQDQKDLQSEDDQKSGLANVIAMAEELLKGADAA
jgi:lambda family phage portal protein